MVDQVKEEGFRRTLDALLLFEQGRYNELVVLAAKYDAEKLWRLSAVARKDLMAGGAALHALVQRVSPNVSQLRVLAGYYGAINDKQQLDRVARLIVQKQNREIERIQALLGKAIEAGQANRSQDLLKRIDALNPAANYELKGLRAKVDKMSISS